MGDFSYNLVPEMYWMKCLWYIDETVGSELGVNPNDCNDKWEIEMTHYEDFLIRLSDSDLCLGLPEEFNGVNEGTPVVLRKCDASDTRVTWFVVISYHDTEKKRVDKM